MSWWVHKEAGSIVWAGQYEQPGYTESIADDDAELLAFLAPKPPTSISNAQLKRQLKADGKLGQAKALIQQVDDISEALWYGAATFERTDPLLVGLATALGYDSDGLDDFFVAAAKL